MTQGDGKCGLRSDHPSCLCHPSSQEDFSYPFPTPALGPPHGRQPSRNFSNLSPSHKLQFFTSMGPFHRVQSLQELAAPVWISHSVTSHDSKPASEWTSLSLRSQVMPGLCSSMGLPRGCSFLYKSSGAI